MKRDAPTGGKKKVPDSGKPKGRQIKGQIKQFRVKLWLEGEEENALCLRRSSWVSGLNVRLRQQKLYKTTFDGHLAPRRLQKAPQQPASAPPPGARRAAWRLPAQGTWPRRPGARREGAGLLLRLEGPPFRAQPPWGAGRARRAGRRLLPGNLGRRAEHGLLGAPPGAAYTTSPARPCSSQGCRHPENV